MEREYIIVVDSCSDLSLEIRQEHHIEYVRMGIVKQEKGGEIQLPASLNWDIYTNKELNDWLREGICIKTTQVPKEEYEEVFTKILDQGKDIIYIACSSALSGSYNYSLIIKEELLEKYKDSKITCIDALNSCMGQGLMAIDAAKLKEAGKSYDEVVNYIEENKLTYNQFATVETLEYLKKAGRVKAGAAFFGNIFGVKPMIISDAKGQNYAIKKIKGRKNSIVELVNMLKESIIEPENQTVYIVHADCMVDALLLKDLIEKEVHPKDVCITYMGPIIGVSTGPGTLGVYAKGKKVEVIGE